MDFNPNGNTPQGGNVAPGQQIDMFQPTGDALVDALGGEQFFREAEGLLNQHPQQQMQQQQNQQPQDNWEVRARYYQSEHDKLKNQMEEHEGQNAGLRQLQEDLENDPRLSQVLYDYYNGGGQQQQYQPPQQSLGVPEHIAPPEEFDPYQLANPSSESGRYFQQQMANLVQQAVQSQMAPIVGSIQQQQQMAQMERQKQQRMTDIRNQLSDVPDNDFNEFTKFLSSAKPSAKDLYQLYQLKNGRAPQLQPNQAMQFNPQQPFGSVQPPIPQTQNIPPSIGMLPSAQQGGVDQNQQMGKLLAGFANGMNLFDMI
jgi:hypothetical protein